MIKLAKFLSRVSKLRVLMSSPEGSRYRDMNKSVERQLILGSYRVYFELYGVHECFFDSTLSRVMKTICDMMLYLGADEYARSGLLDVQGRARINSLQLIHALGGLMFSFRLLTCCNSSVDAYPVIRKQLHCRVLRLLRDPTEKALRFVRMKGDIEGAGAGNCSIPIQFHSSNGAVANVS